MNQAASILPDVPPEQLQEMLLGAYKNGYGFPDQWEPFAERNREFIQAYPELMEMSWRLFSPARKYSLKSHGIVCFALLGLAQQDFQHILCLAVNAHGGAAQARVRTMFEHVVLAGYFAKHPEKTEAYVHFQIVEQRKNLTRARDLYSTPKHLQLREKNRSLEAAFRKGIFEEMDEYGFRSAEQRSRVGGVLSSLLSHSQLLRACIAFRLGCEAHRRRTVLHRIRTRHAQLR